MVLDGSVDESWDGTTVFGLHSVCGRPPRDLEPRLSEFSRGRRSPAPVSTEGRDSLCASSGVVCLREREGETPAEERRAINDGNLREVRREGRAGE